MNEKALSVKEVAEAVKAAAATLIDVVAILVPLGKALDLKVAMIYGTGKDPDEDAEKNPASIEFPESTIERMKKAGYTSAAAVLQDDAETIQKKMALTETGMRNLVWRFHQNGLRIRGAEPEDPNV